MPFHRSFFNLLFWSDVSSFNFSFTSPKIGPYATQANAEKTVAGSTAGPARSVILEVPLLSGLLFAGQEQGAALKYEGLHLIKTEQSIVHCFL